MRRIILEKLDHSLLQVPVVFIRIVLEVDGLASISTPGQLHSRWVIQSHYQRPNENGRSLALNRAKAALPWTSARPAITSRAQQVYALFLLENILTLGRL